MKKIFPCLYIEVLKNIISYQFSYSFEQQVANQYSSNNINMRYQRALRATNRGPWRHLQKYPKNHFCQGLPAKKRCCFKPNWLTKEVSGGVIVKNMISCPIWSRVDDVEKQPSTRNP